VPITDDGPSSTPSMLVDFKKCENNFVGENNFVYKNLKSLFQVDLTKHGRKLLGGG
jgi:hypothetical protein